MVATKPPLTRLAFEVLKSVAHGAVWGSRTWTWRDASGTAVTTTMRSLIEDGLVRVQDGLDNGRRVPRVTQAGYVELSRAAHAYTRKKTKKR